MAASNSSTLLRNVSPMDVFNLPLYEHHLVIDIRSREEYEAGHIATAVSHPSPGVDCSDGEREKDLIEFIKAYVSEYYRPENPSPIVLYGNTTPECLTHAEWLAKKLEKLKTDRKIVANVSPPNPSDEPEISEDKKFNPFEHFCLTIADHAKEIWILEGGYESFCSKYDFLCGHVEFTSMFPLPHQINEFLFLGSRVFPLTRDCLGKLGITHMIVSEYQKLDWSQLEGISVLRCSVQDKNSQDMVPCWEACTMFISEAISGQNVKFESDLESVSVNASREAVAITSSDETGTGGTPKAITSLNQTVTGTQNVIACSNPDQQSQMIPGIQEKPDKQDIDVMDTYTSTMETSSARILVILFGRSRSTSVVLAYLMRAHGMSFDEAWGLISTRCWHLVDRSLVYEEQLRTVWQEADHM